MLDYLSVGYVLKPQGNRGEIKIEPLTDYIERFDELDTLYIKKTESYLPVELLSYRQMGKHLILKLEGYEDIDSAEKLKGEYLWIPRHKAKILPEDTFLIADIIGCRVFTQDGEELGSVDRIIHTGSNDVYVVIGPKGEILIPGLKKVVLKVDIPGKEIIVAAQELEGLLPDED